MNKEELNIFCRKCNERADVRGELIQGNLQIREQIGKQGKLLPTDCRLLKLYSDSVLDAGKDSLVLKQEVDGRLVVLKYYFSLPYKAVLKYKEEIDRLGDYFKNTELIDPDGLVWGVRFNPINEIFEMPNGCVVAVSDFIPGGNYADNQLGDDDAEDYSYMLNGMLDSYFFSQGKGSPNRMACQIADCNIIVNEEERIITVTDPASSIRSFLWHVS